MKDTMTPSPHTIGAEQTIEEAKKRMYAEGFRHLPVLEGGQCIGILSDRDIKLAYAIEKDSAGKLKITDVCSSDVYTVTISDAVKEVAGNMAKSGIGSAVVLERGKVVGIFTTTDALRVLSKIA